MLATQRLINEAQKARWTPDPETEAAMDFIMASITRPEQDGKSMLERVYLICDFEAQRDEEIQSAVFAILQERFPKEHCFFQADCPDDGRCRFRLKAGDTYARMSASPAAKREYFLNLLKTPDEWIRPPLNLTQLVKQKPESKQKHRRGKR